MAGAVRLVLTQIKPAIGVRKYLISKTWNNRAVILWRLNQPTAALKSVEKALSRQPNDATAWFNQGRILSTLQRPEAAIAA